MSIPDRIKQAVKESGYNEDIGNVLANMYRYMERNDYNFEWRIYNEMYLL